MILFKFNFYALSWISIFFCLINFVYFCHCNLQPKSCFRYFLSSLQLFYNRFSFPFCFSKIFLSLSLFSIHLKWDRLDLTFFMILMKEYDFHFARSTFVPWRSFRLFKLFTTYLPIYISYNYLGFLLFNNILNFIYFILYSIIILFTISHYHLPLICSKPFTNSITKFL